MTIDAEALTRLLLAALFSLPIGLERENAGKPAGVRTHLLLATTTAALGWLSIEVAEGRQGTDAARIASYTVAGIGFLGAGLIVGVRGQVHGLTTAVAAFTVTAIGLLTGMGYAEVGGALALVSLLTLGPIEWIKVRSYGRVVRSVCTVHVIAPGAEVIRRVHDAAAEAPTSLQSLEYTPVDGQVVVSLTIRGRQGQLQDTIAALSQLEGVVGVTSVGHGTDAPD